MAVFTKISETAVKFAPVAGALLLPAAIMATASVAASFLTPLAARSGEALATRIYGRREVAATAPEPTPTKQPLRRTFDVVEGEAAAA